MSGNAGGAAPLCSHCGSAPAPAAALLRCSSCRRVRYCGAPCARAAWRAGHKAACAWHVRRQAATAQRAAGLRACICAIARASASAARVAQAEPGGAVGSALESGAETTPGGLDAALCRLLAAGLVPAAVKLVDSPIAAQSLDALLCGASSVLSSVAPAAVGAPAAASAPTRASVTAAAAAPPVPPRCLLLAAELGDAGWPLLEVLLQSPRAAALCVAPPRPVVIDVFEAPLLSVLQRAASPLYAAVRGGSARSVSAVVACATAGAADAASWLAEPSSAATGKRPKAQRALSSEEAVFSLPPLVFAAAAGAGADVLRVLLQAGASPSALASRCGVSPLVACAGAGWWPMSDDNSYHYGDSNDSDTFWRGDAVDDDAALRSLLDASPHPSDELLARALLAAIIAGAPACASVLLAAGAQLPLCITTDAPSSAEGSPAAEAPTTPADAPAATAAPLDPFEPTCATDGAPRTLPVFSLLESIGKCGALVRLLLGGMRGGGGGALNPHLAVQPRRGHRGDSGVVTLLAALVGTTPAARPASWLPLPSDDGRFGDDAIAASRVATAALLAAGASPDAPSLPAHEFAAWDDGPRGWRKTEWCYTEESAWNCSGTALPPLVWACLRRNPGAVSALRAAGASVAFSVPWNGESAAPLALWLCQLALSGNCSMQDREGVVGAHRRPAYGACLLELLPPVAHDFAAMQLQAASAVGGWTVLHYAALLFSTPVVRRVLIAVGDDAALVRSASYARVVLRECRDDFDAGCMSLHFAAAGGLVESLEACVSAAMRVFVRARPTATPREIDDARSELLHARNARGFSPAAFAASFTCTAILERLRAWGVDTASVVAVVKPPVYHRLAPVTITMTGDAQRNGNWERKIDEAIAASIREVHSGEGEPANHSQPRAYDGSAVKIKPGGVAR